MGEGPWLAQAVERVTFDLRVVSLSPTLGVEPTKNFFKKFNFRGAWVAESIKCPTSAQVMISQFVSSSPASGTVLTAQSLEPASDSVSPLLSLPTTPRAHAPSLSVCQ